MSIDPVTFLDTGSPRFFNRYVYTFNDPINLTDPDGRNPGIDRRADAIAALPLEDKVAIMAGTMRAVEVGLVAGDLVLGGPTGEGIIPAAGIAAGRKALTNSAKKKATSKTVKKVNQKRLEAAKKDFGDAQSKFKELSSAKDKTPEIKAEIATAKKAMNKAEQRMKKVKSMLDEVKEEIVNNGLSNRC